MYTIENLNEIAEKLRKLEVEYSKLEWTQYTTGFDFGSERVYENIIKEFKDDKNYDCICSLMQKDLTPKDKRRAELMYNAFEPYHLSDELNKLEMEIQKKSTELSKILNTHRSFIDGKEVSSVDIAQILNENDDREIRKKAYFARSQVNKPLVDGGFIKLIDLRKEYASIYGAKDFAALELKKQELDSSIFDNWVDEIHEMLPKINDIRESYAKKYLNDDKIMPWDETYINSKIAPSLNKKVDMSSYYSVISNFFKTFGVDITKYNITYDIFSRKNKSEWGYNFTIDTGRDSRILANVKDRYNEYGVLLHETGHGIHSFLLDADETILNYGVSGIISEGIANLFGSFVHENIFYSHFFNETDNVEKEFSEIKEYKKANALRAVETILFDQDLYRYNIKSIEDIYNLHWKTHKSVLKEEPFYGEPAFGYRIHHTTHPIYLHNYFMGDVTCEMISKVFNNKFGTESITEKPLDFMDFLTNEVIKVSGLYKYGELFKRISGEEFSLKYL